MRNGKAKPDTKRKDNSIGNKQNEYAREQAKKAISAGKKVERQRKKAGWIWIKKGKTRKQVHPDKININLDNQWEQLKS